MLYIRRCAVVQEFADGRVAFLNHPVTPTFSKVMSAGVLFAPGIEGVDGSSQPFRVVFLADNLADVLQVAATGFVLANATGFLDGRPQGVADGRVLS